MKTLDSTTTHKFDKNWEIATTNKSFSSDDLINAYLVGKKQAIKATQEEKFDKLRKTVKRISDITIEFDKLLKEYGFRLQHNFLKIKNPTSFEILTFVREKDFLHKNFIEIYKKAVEIETKEQNENNISVQFIFSDWNKESDERLVFNDGFALKHKQIS